MQLKKIVLLLICVLGLTFQGICYAGYADDYEYLLKKMILPGEKVQATRDIESFTDIYGDITDNATFKGRLNNLTFDAYSEKGIMQTILVIFDNYDPDYTPSVVRVLNKKFGKAKTENTYLGVFEWEYKIDKVIYKVSFFESAGLLEIKK